MNYIGIDPGNNGAIAVRTHTGDVETLPLSTTSKRDIAVFMLFRSPGIAVIEEVHSSPQQGVRSAFTFGRSFGQLEMAIACNNLTMHTVRPQKWRLAMQVRKVAGGIGKNDTEKKRATRERAQELFPNLNITHAIADALLLMEFGRLFHGEVE